LSDGGERFTRAHEFLSRGSGGHANGNKKAVLPNDASRLERVRFEMNLELAGLAVALVALLVSIVALGQSVYFWRLQFRPIVTAAVRTHSSGNVAIAYDLVIQNSGMIPAKNIRIRADAVSLAAAFGADATPQNKHLWLACFEDDPAVSILQNGDRTSCSFGMTTANEKGFWKYGSTISIELTYEGWFGGRYVQPQLIKIADSNSFTGHHWA
jgi:hypothetical protein